MCSEGVSSPMLQAFSPLVKIANFGWMENWKCSTKVSIPDYPACQELSFETNPMSHITITGAKATNGAIFVNLAI